MIMRGFRVLEILWCPAGLIRGVLTPLTLRAPNLKKISRPILFKHKMVELRSHPTKYTFRKGKKPCVMCALVDTLRTDYYQDVTAMSSAVQAMQPLFAA